MDNPDKDLVIYGTFSENDKLRDDEILLIKELSKWNYIVVVQNGLAVDPLVHSLDCSYILRTNLGRDFGMLRDTLQLINISSSARNLIWLNSSCIWNGADLQELINRERSHQSSDVISMTDSWRGGYHLQSFFYLVHSNSINAFQEFFNFSNVRNWKFKRTVVFFGEKKLSTYLKNSGLKLGSFYPARNFSKHQYKLITTYFDFKNQLSNAGAPFVKL
jgi:hypothetical protein